LRDALRDGVLRRIQGIVQKLKRVPFSGVVNRKMLVEYCFQATLDVPFLWGDVSLNEVFETLELDL